MISILWNRIQNRTSIANTFVIQVPTQAWLTEFTSLMRIYTTLQNTMSDIVFQILEFLYLSDYPTINYISYLLSNWSSLKWKWHGITIIIRLLVKFKWLRQEKENRRKYRNKTSRSSKTQWTHPTGRIQYNPFELSKRISEHWRSKSDRNAFFNCLHSRWFWRIGNPPIGRSRSGIEWRYLPQGKRKCYSVCGAEKGIKKVHSLVCVRLILLRYKK